MGLRGCAPTEAAKEFRAAAEETGTAAEDLAHALVTQASTDDDATAPPSHSATTGAGEQVQQRWGALLTARGLDDAHHTTTIPANTRVRYGPENTSTLC